MPASEGASAGETDTGVAKVMVVAGLVMARPSRSSTLCHQAAVQISVTETAGAIK